MLLQINVLTLRHHVIEFCRDEGEIICEWPTGFPTGFYKGFFQFMNTSNGLIWILIFFLNKHNALKIQDFGMGV